MYKDNFNILDEDEIDEPHIDFTITYDSSYNEDNFCMPLRFCESKLLCLKNIMKGEKPEVINKIIKIESSYNGDPELRPQWHKDEPIMKFAEWDEEDISILPDNLNPTQKIFMEEIIKKCHPDLDEVQWEGQHTYSVDRKLLTDWQSKTFLTILELAREKE